MYINMEHYDENGNINIDYVIGAINELQELFASLTYSDYEIKAVIRERIKILCNVYEDETGETAVLWIE